MVVVATLIACWRGARAWPEVAVAAACSEEILTAWRLMRCGFLEKKRGGGGVYMGDLDLARGLGFG
jgi:hypothetical protein